MKKEEAEKLTNELMESGFNAGWRAEPYRPADITVRVYGREQNNVINRELVKILLKQINDHSSKICHLIDELKCTWGSVGSPADKKVDELKKEIAIQNECIQDVLVSFSDLYLSR